MASIDEEIKTEFMNDRHRFIANMVFTSGWMKNQFADFLKPYGLSSPQFNILRILRGASDWKAMNDVKDLMVEKSPNTTRLVDKLLNKQLIKRKRSASDRRVVYVAITPVGLDLLKEIDKEDNGDHVSFLEKITEEEAKQVNDILNKIRS
jgi:DNA-binding MarR family transcriptional regulator